MRGAALLLAVGALLVLAPGQAPAVDVCLEAPAATLIPVTGPVPAGGVIVHAEITVPADAPADLGVGAWAGDRHGSWAGRPWGRIAPGRQTLAISVAADAPAEGPAGWGPWPAATVAKAGLFLWSASSSRARITVHALSVAAAPPPAAQPLRVVDVAWPAQAATGHRWEATFRVTPEPADPFDPQVVDAAITITTPQGTTERHGAFWDQPMADRDRGDGEDVTPAGPGRFAVRWRPRTPGVHRLQLTVTAGGTTRTAELPAITVTGAPWDDYVRVDAHDPRFLSVAGRWYWPVGLNLRSVNDTRSVENLGTQPVPERGTRAYAAYLDRGAAVGITAAEVWLSSWNLALEWQAAWDGFFGVGRYHLGHAWQLDRVLEHAEANGQRLVLVLHNHGQGSSNCDREWATSPYRRANGGWLDDASHLFSDDRARAAQRRLHRYLIARYADSPAVLAWKLWSEVDLTDGARTNHWAEVTAWHREMAQHIAGEDPYRHLVTTHFSGSWRRVHPPIAQLADVGLLTIDAYHGGADEAGGMSLADLLTQSVGPRGLAKYGKPVLTTECGGQSLGAPEPLLLADHQMGPWVGFVSGMAGAPMLWWAQWVDQRGLFAPYRAIAAFVAGEDARGAEVATSAVLRGEPEDIWARAWVRPGRMLGYVHSRRWATDGSRTPLSGSRITVGDMVSPGAMCLQWWSADTGTAAAPITIDHPGGALVLTLPTAHNHLAFKLWRPTAPVP